MNDTPETEFAETEFAEMREEIVAYLDGELSVEQTAIVEKRLVNDEIYRAELQQLQKTWDMLDLLPRTTASEDFTRTTIQTAALKTQKSGSLVTKLRRVDWRWLATAVAVICCGLTGYVWSSASVHMPDEELARDLDLIRSFELFEEVNSISFLERIADLRIFDTESDGDAMSQPPVPLENMDGRQLYQLKLKKEKFEALAEKPAQSTAQDTGLSEQDRYRRLYNELQAHSNRDELKRILVEYNLWLTSLPVQQSFQLAEMSTEEQIQKVVSLRRQQAIQTLGFYSETPLPSEDLEKIVHWLDNFRSVHHDRILKVVRKQLKQASASGRFRANNAELDRRMQDKSLASRMVLYAMMRMREEQRDEVFKPEDIESLKSSLSPAGAKIVQRAIEEDKLLRLLGSCMKATRIDHVSDAELQKFFDEKLTAEQQSKLDWMSPDDRDEALRRAYGLFELSDQPVPMGWEPERFTGGGDYSKSRSRDGRSKPARDNSARDTSARDNPARDNAGQKKRGRNNPNEDQSR